MSEEVQAIESEARLFGWVPKEEFRGGEENWVDAETFVKRGKELNPILRANNERLKKELAEERDKHNKELAEIKQTAEEFKKFQKEAFERKQEQLKKEIDELKQQRKEAIKEGDGDLVVEIEDKLEELKEEQAKKPEPPAEPPKQAETQLDPSLSEWLDRNKWYGQDVETTEIVNGMGAAIRRQFPDLVGKKFLEKLDERLQQRFPDLYENPSKAQTNVDSSTTRSGSSSKKKSYENLPNDAKAACDKFVKQGLFKSREEYVELYDWSE